MIVTIHQPEHLVWLGLIKKISDADVFVILDSVQFEKNYFQNRNKIRTKDGWIWLTVPVKNSPLETLIKDIEISYDKPWQKKYLTSLRINYGKAKYFNNYYSKVESVILKKYKYLSDLNIELLYFLLEEFGISKKKIFKASEMSIQNGGGASNVCLQICKKFEKCTYLAGPSGKDYLKLQDFEDAGYKVVFHDFKHPEYKQVYGGFLPFMSSLDALFNLGLEAKKIL
jgi:hypothetical protein